ncbi:hypothetical protein LZ30DRAFT_420002 [Colletotrichum cereale]|nr:hypothetical protein LZ30DRAFT_420002 [Colletotrichum cereale]
MPAMITPDLFAPTSTTSVSPPGFVIQSLTNTQQTSGTWISTTASDSLPIIIPVLVGCVGCRGPGGGILLLMVGSFNFGFPTHSNSNYSKGQYDVLGSKY